MDSKRSNKKPGLALLGLCTLVLSAAVMVGAMDSIGTHNQYLRAGEVSCTNPSGCRAAAPQKTAACGTPGCRQDVTCEGPGCRQETACGSPSGCRATDNEAI